MRSRRVLYLTYDGLMEPLGQSQVLAYLELLADKYCWNIDLVSFEKGDISDRRVKALSRKLVKKKILWYPFRFTDRPKVLGTLVDMFRLFIAVTVLLRRKEYAILHARSVIPAVAGFLALKVVGLYGKVKFIFDTRGFWALQRKESGEWNLSNPLMTFVYFVAWKSEVLLYGKADHLVVLTGFARRILGVMKQTGLVNRLPTVSVIPCCAVPDKIPVATSETKKSIRAEFGLPSDAFIVGFTGAFISWYRHDWHIRFFRELVNVWQNAFLFLAIKNLSPYAIAFFKDRLRGLEGKYIITTLSHDAARRVISAFDAGLIFCQPTFSSHGASPTKLAEYLIAGVPVVATPVGDIPYILAETGGGVIVKELSVRGILEAVRELLSLRIDPLELRSRAIEFFSVYRGAALYHSVYLK